MNFTKRFLKLLLLTIADLIRYNYAYHSGALTYHFMLSLAPLTIVLVSLLSLLPFFDVSEVQRVVDRFFPQYTGKVLHEIFQVQEKGVSTSFIALGLSYVFSVGFIKNVSRAFAYVSEGVLGLRKELFYWLFMPVFMTGSVLVLLAGFLMSIYLKIIVPKAFSVLLDLSYMLPGSIVLFLLYLSFLKEKVGLLPLMGISLFISLLMFFIQVFFTWYIAEIFKGSLLYGSLSTVIVFLLWTNLVFLILLLGARLIYRLKNS